jgi:small subunit ribosomal protein S6
MVRDYELMYIVRPDLDEEALQAANATVDQLVTGLGGTVVRSTSWGRRRLAYEVNHLRDGHYMLLHIRLDGARVADVERALTISETVFRHLLVLREEVADEAAEPEAVAAETPRQAPVAGSDEDEANDDDEEDDDIPAAVLAGAEEDI